MTESNKDMNKADEEIIEILKETFWVKKSRLCDPDDYLKCLILKVFLGLSILGAATCITFKLLGKEVPQGTGEFVSIQLSMFFGFLFIYINSKSENFSVLIFALTWASMTFGFYFGSF